MAVHMRMSSGNATLCTAAEALMSAVLGLRAPHMLDPCGKTGVRHGSGEPGFDPIPSGWLLRLRYSDFAPLPHSRPPPPLPPLRLPPPHLYHCYHHLRYHQHQHHYHHHHYHTATTTITMITPSHASLKPPSPQPRLPPPSSPTACSVYYRASGKDDTI